MNINFTLAPNEKLNKIDENKTCSSASVEDSESFQNLLENEQVQEVSSNNDVENEEQVINQENEVVDEQVDPAFVKAVDPTNNKKVLDLKFFIQERRNLTNSHFKFSESKDMFKVDINNVDKNDIEFFKSCVDNNNISMNNFNMEAQKLGLKALNESTGVSYKSLDISKGLVNLIEQAQKTQKPVRLDFGDNSSVILKIGKDGQLSVAFVSSDAAMEQLLKANLPYLRSKMDAEGIPYKEIAYKERNNQKEENNKGGQTDE